MQGTLGMESADHCRISYQKVQFLLGLEAAEVIFVFASEILSFVQLQGPLSEGLPWLHWVPPCLLVIGLFEFLLDVYYTLESASMSHFNWRPLPVLDSEKIRES